MTLVVLPGLKVITGPQVTKSGLLGCLSLVDELSGGELFVG